MRLYQYKIRILSVFNTYIISSMYLYNTYILRTYYVLYTYIILTLNIEKERNFIMNGYILKESMYNFINKIGAVSYEQIQLMYGNVYDKDTIKWSVKQLIAECLISKDSETDLITRRGNIDLSDFQQKQRTNAAWIIASMGVSKIREFWASDYPCQFLIITEDDEVYDITTFSAYTVDSLSMIVPIRRKAMLSEDAEDSIIHIALVADKEVANDIQNLEFDTYCILDKEHKPHYYDWK